MWCVVFCLFVCFLFLFVCLFFVCLFFSFLFLLQNGIAGSDGPETTYRSIGKGKHQSFKNVTIDCTYQREQNFAVLNIPKCNNFRLRFRPYNVDEEPGPQSLAPGLSVKVNAKNVRFDLKLARYVQLKLHR